MEGEFTEELIECALGVGGKLLVEGECTSTQSEQRVVCWWRLDDARVAIRSRDRMMVR